VAYLASRNISVWSVDVISGDTDPGATSARITSNVLSRVKQAGKGIILFHDIKKPTAEAVDGILTELEKDGYRFVHVVSNTYYQPNPELVARVDAFREPLEARNMTGHWTPSQKEDVKDGSVDVMHTEWIDLQEADEKLTGHASGGDATKPHSETRQGASLTSNGWFANGQIR
jgi:hypothetical protein